MQEDMHHQTEYRGRSQIARRLRQYTALLVCAAVVLVTGLHAAVQAQTEYVCFEETGYCITGRIREYWEQNGGLRVFGYPISPQREEAIENRVLQVQEFERNRLELHPENARPYDVLLGRLGADCLIQQERDWLEFPRSNAMDGCRFFPETGHNVCGVFLDSWRASGLSIDDQPGYTEAENLALFGLPLSDVQAETLSDGRIYVVQWFERARFESHPLNPPPYHVLFGLLGNEVKAADQGGGTPTPTTDPDVTTTATPQPGDTTTPTPQPGATVTPSPTPEPPKGKIAFASERESGRNIFVMNVDGGNPTNLTQNAFIDSVPSWSPDGTKVAFASERDGNREIYVMNADGSGQMRLTNHKDDDWNPIWSPDGWRIAFESYRNGNWEIYVMSIDGNRQSNVTNHPGNDRNPSWSPDGSQLAFQSDRTGDWEIYAMNADGTRQHNLTENQARDEQPAWSPDGSHIAFVSNRDADRDIFLMETDGSRPIRLTNGSGKDEQPAWSPDSKQIVFRSERDGNGEIYVMDVDGRNAKNLTENLANDRDPSWWGPAQ